MKWLSFIVAAAPKPWQRTGKRIEETDGGELMVRIYDTRRNRNLKDVVRWAYVEARGPRNSGAPVIMVVKSFIKRPKTVTAALPCRQRDGDVDNYAKLVMDALNTLSYADDSQVAALLTVKDWARNGEVPRIEIDLLPVSDVVAYAASLRRDFKPCINTIFGL